MRSDPAPDAVLLEYLRRQGVKGSGDVYDLDGWQLHTHPDLGEHLQKLCPPCYGGRYGVSVLAGAGGVVFAVAMGTSTLAFRLDEASRAEALDAGGREWRDAGPGWIAVEPWRTPFETLKRWCRRAQADATPHRGLSP